MSALPMISDKVSGGKSSFGLSWITIALAVLTSGASFAGWVLGIVWLRGFGISNYPDWPLTAIAHLLLALAITLLLRGRPRLSILVSAPSLCIAVITLAEYASGADLGVDRLLFHDSVATVGNVNPGRPGLIPAISVFLLSAAIWLAAYRIRGAAPAIMVLSCLAVGLGSMSIALLMLGADLRGEPFRLASSLPAGLSPIALSLALIACRAGMERSSPRAGLEWQIARLALPAIIVLPAILFPIEVRITREAFVPPIAVEIVASVLNLAVVIALLTWASLSLQRETRALRRSEQRLALATEAHGVGVFEWNNRTGKIVWNPGAEERLGLPPGAITDFESWMVYVDPADVATVLAAVSAATARKANRYEFRYRFRRPDGDVRQIEGSAHCIYDEGGSLLISLGVNVDVTERDRREAELRSIVETVPAALVVIDERGVVRRFSPAAERMFGWTSAEMIGCNVSRLMPSDIGVQHDSYVLRYLTGGERHIVGQTRTLKARRRDGATFPIELNVGEAWTAGERLFTGFVSDISERVSATFRSEELRLEYGHVARLAVMGEMAAGLAHELNQPLAAGANFLSAAELTFAEDPAGAIKAVGQGREQVLRAGAIIRGLRDFLAKGEADTDVQPVAEVIRDALALALVGRDRARIAVSLDLDPDAPLMLADRVQVQQVLVNLLRNAAEALADREDGGRITIATRVAPDGLLVTTVRDNGPGLAENILQQPFAPFVSTKQAGGMGVGLSICRRIVEAHGGTMRAENCASGGASLSFTVPRPSEAEEYRA